MAARFAQLRFTFATSASEMLAAAPEAEVIFAKGIPARCWKRRRSHAGCRPVRLGWTACCARDWASAACS
ncbi:MAG: hypothetical protein WKG07_35905 [Hymenobacter sp.]